MLSLCLLAQLPVCLLSACLPLVSTAIEKRWTLFSSLWYLWQELRFFGTPPAVRYIWHLLWRAVMMRLYETHKTLVLWRKSLTPSSLTSNAVQQRPCLCRWERALHDISIRGQCSTCRCANAVAGATLSRELQHGLCAVIAVAQAWWTEALKQGCGSCCSRAFLVPGLLQCARGSPQGPLEHPQWFLSKVQMAPGELVAVAVTAS